MLKSKISDAFFIDSISEIEVQKQIEDIYDCLNNLSRSIDMFRNTHIHDSQQPSIAIKDILLQLIQFKEESKDNCKVKIQHEFSGNCQIHGSQVDFSHAIDYILENAYDVLIRNNIKDPVIKMKCIELNDSVVISIIDNGGGIDPMIKDTMFDLYTTTKNNLNFTGAGLYISKLIIEKNMKGKIEVNEANRPFTEFKITLPKVI